MSDFVFNAAKGKVAHYASLATSTANDGLIVVPLEASTLEVDSALMERVSLQDIIDGPSTVQSAMGRKDLTGVTVTINTTADSVTVDADDFTFTAATGAAISAFVVCYVPDIGVSPDHEVVPLTKHDFSAVPNGGDIPIQISPTGLFVAKSPAG